jgi:putative glutamine amidotransferase
LLPPLEDVDQLRLLFDRVDGLILPGGVDIHPSRYGEEVLPECGKIDAVRDAIEVRLADWAVREEKPLLAICRGIQVLNVALGGSLYQDIGAARPESGRHDWYPGFARDRLSHRIQITAGSRLAGIVHHSHLEVNSLHHQAVKVVGKGLHVSATAEDGIIEGLEVPGHPFALGVQWHPEELAAAQPQARALFEALVHAAASV